MLSRQHGFHAPWSTPPQCRRIHWTQAFLAAGAGAVVGALSAGLGKQFMQPDKSIRRPICPEYGVEDEQFTRTMGHLLRPQIVPGNRVKTLVNGDEIFPEMLHAIRSAEHTITMESYIYWSGRIGREFAAALAERGRAGVRCHVLLDYLGSQRIDPHSLDLMRKDGVQVNRYHRHWWKLARFNHRTHRKLLTIDGKVGFTGGVGIADQWLGHAQDEHHWRDNHYKIEGPVVAQLQSAFTDNWLKSQHVVLHDHGYFPKLEAAGTLDCQVFQSSPDEGSESMRLMYHLAIAAARRSIRIATAYFVPDDLTIETLVQARQRGVEIDIIVPGPQIDVQIVRHASRATWSDLLRAGVRIFEYWPTMYHTKVMVVDDLWTSIGSTNFDNRSFRLNDEANLNVYDRAFAAAQVKWFERDKERCREMTAEEWENRPAGQKAADEAAEIVSSQL